MHGADLVYLTVEVDWRQNFVEHQWLWWTVQPAGPCSHTVAARHRPVQQVRSLLLKEPNIIKVSSRKGLVGVIVISQKVLKIYFSFFFLLQRRSCCLQLITVHISLNNRIINNKWAGAQSFTPCLILSAVTHAFRFISVSIFPYSITGQVIEYKQVLN